MTSPSASHDALVEDVSSQGEMTTSYFPSAGGTKYAYKTEDEMQEGSQRVLVVEDNDEIRFMMSLVLEERCQVDAVGSYDAALEQIDAEDYGVIFIDIDLGEERTGLDLADRLHKERSTTGTALVACTAYAMPGDRETFLQNGFDYYVGKPFTEKDLLEAFDRARPKKPGK